MAKHIKIGSPVNDAERWAFEYLAKRLPDSHILLSNLEILTQTGQPMEVDALVIGHYAIYLVDVKGYTGRLVVEVNSWELNDRWVENSLAKANYVARVLASRIKDRLPSGVHAPWCQGMVFVTGRQGDNIQIAKQYPELSIFCPDNIENALTDKDYVTSKNKYEITKQQRDFALEVIGKVGVMASRQNHIQDFVKDKLLGSVNGIEIWDAHYQLGDWTSAWLLKLVQSGSANSEEELNLKSTQLKQEFYRLQQLSGISGIPVTAPLISDGEQFVLPIKRPRGKPISTVDKSQFDTDKILRVLREAVACLQQIHQRGCTLGTISEKSVFLSEEGDIEFLEVRDDLDVVSDIQHFKKLIWELACHSGVEEVSNWFQSDDEDADLELLRLSLNKALLGLEDEVDIGSVEVAEGAVFAGKYQLLTRLAKSANGDHWKAKHVAGQFECVLSIYNGADELWQDASLQYSGLMQLYHPAIERIFDIDLIESENIYYISRAWVDGETLLSIAEDADSAQLRDIFRQLLVGLQYLHQQGLIHKNITPETIIFSNEKAVLVNFSGLPKELVTSENLRYTDSSIQDTGWTAQADLYSLVLSFAGAVDTTLQIEESTPENITSAISYFLDETSIEAINEFLTLQQTVDEEVNYLELFALEDSDHRVEELPETIVSEWGISKGYMTFMVLDMLNDQRPRSRNQWVLNALRSRHIAGNKTNRSSMSATISRMKASGIAEEYGKKVRLTEKFIEEWKSSHW